VRHLLHLKSLDDDSKLVLAQEDVAEVQDLKQLLTSDVALFVGVCLRNELDELVTVLVKHRSPFHFEALQIVVEEVYGRVLETLLAVL
jgi:hypothetical protein